MRKFFDCLSCDNSFSDNGDKLFCVFKKQTVKDTNICTSHTDLEYEFPMAMKTGLYKQFYENSEELITLLKEREEID